MSGRSDVIVVGGGVVGCWTAWNLAHQGLAVTVVERDTIGGGASYGNCGYICPSHVHPLCGPGAIANGMKAMFKSGGALSIPPRWDPKLWSWLWQFTRRCNATDFETASVGRHALLQSAMHLYCQYALEHSAEIDWQPNGLLMVYRDQDDWQTFEKSANELRNRFQLRVERHDAQQLCELEPSLREGLAGGWYFPDDAHVSPAGLVQSVRRTAETAGAVFREHCEVTDLVLKDRTLQSLRLRSGETLAADTFIFTTGAEAGHFAKALGMSLPVVPGKGYSVTIKTDEALPRIPMIFEQDHVALTSLTGALRVGSTMQLTGYSRTIPEKRIALLKRSAEQHLKSPLPVGPEQRWAGWRPMMPDGLPCIDQSPRAGNAWIAAGNGMIGMATGASTGKLVAELATLSDPHLDPAPYRLSRLTGKTHASASSQVTPPIEGSS